MQTEVYSSGPPSPEHVGLGELVIVTFRRKQTATIRVTTAYGQQGSQTGTCMTFVISLIRGSEEYVMVTQKPCETKDTHVGTFEFNAGDRVQVSASSLDPSEGDVAATVFVDVG